MPKYLFIGTYAPEGVKGVLKEGGSGRLEAARTTVESVGGQLEAMYFGFGSEDWYVLADLPDPSAAAAIGLTVGSSGTSRARTVVLMTPEEVDAATKLTPNFRPPGA